MKPSRLFKGPLFARPSKPSQPFNASDPVARGVIDEEDFLNQKAGRPTRKDLEATKKNIDNH